MRQLSTKTSCGVCGYIDTGETVPMVDGNPALLSCQDPHLGLLQVILRSQTASSPPFLYYDVIDRGGRVWSR